MKLKRYAVMAVFVLATFGGGALAGRFLATAQTRPQPGVRNAPAAPQRWEYCSLTRAAYPGSVRGGLYWISYFNDDGVRVVEVEEQATERSGPAKAIAKLGAEGWEMVGQGPLEIRQGGLNAIYFKRPRN